MKTACPVRHSLSRHPRTKTRNSLETLVAQMSPGLKPTIPSDQTVHPTLTRFPDRHVIGEKRLRVSPCGPGLGAATGSAKRSRPSGRDAAAFVAAASGVGRRGPRTESHRLPRLPVVKHRGPLIHWESCCCVSELSSSGTGACTRQRIRATRQAAKPRNLSGFAWRTPTSSASASCFTSSSYPRCLET